MSLCPSAHSCNDGWLKGGVSVVVVVMVTYTVGLVMVTSLLGNHNSHGYFIGRLYCPLYFCCDWYPCMGWREGDMYKLLNSFTNVATITPECEVSNFDYTCTLNLRIITPPYIHSWIFPSFPSTHMHVPLTQLLLLCYIEDFLQEMFKLTIPLSTCSAKTNHGQILWQLIFPLTIYRNGLILAILYF